MTKQNAINNTLFNFPIGPNLPGLAYPNAFIDGGSSANGNNDIYTCPTGKRALVYGYTLVNNGAGTTTHYGQIKVSGTYYQISISSTTVSPGVGLGFSSFPIILDAGEIFSIHTNTTTNSLWASVIEFDTTAITKTSKVISMSNGDNTIYTVPAGKTAFMSDVYGGLNFNGNPSFGYFNNSGGTRLLNMNIVTSGGSPGSTNKILNNLSIANLGVAANFVVSCSMEAGDFLVVNTDKHVG